MRVLGIRVSPTETRYAVVERDDDDFEFVNRDGENRLVYPVAASGVEAKLAWLYDEIARILRGDGSIEQVCIKTPEYVRAENGSHRDGIRLEAAVMLAAAQAGKPVCSRLYSQLGTRRISVKEHAAQRVAAASVRWNEQMADAVVVAWSLARRV